MVLYNNRTEATQFSFSVFTVTVVTVFQIYLHTVLCTTRGLEPCTAPKTISNDSKPLQT